MTRLSTIAVITLILGCDKSARREEPTRSSHRTSQRDPGDTPPTRDQLARLEREIQKQVEIGLTQYGIKCYLETSVTGCEPSSIDGRYLAHAYIPSRIAAGMGVGESPIVAMGQFLCSGPKAAEREKKRGASGPFPERWHEASTGLAAVHPILEKLRDKSVKIFLPDFPPDLRDGVIRDLESIERVLKAAEERQVRFYLALDV